MGKSSRQRKEKRGLTLRQRQGEQDRLSFAQSKGMKLIKVFDWAKKMFDVYGKGIVMYCPFRPPVYVKQSNENLTEADLFFLEEYDPQDSAVISRPMIEECPQGLWVTTIEQENSILCNFHIAFAEGMETNELFVL